MITRYDYMAGKCTHEQYYAQFVTAEIKAYVVGAITMERLRASGDHHLNDIPLIVWDNLCLNRADIQARLKAAGDGLSMAGLVCIAKQAARMALIEDKQLVA